MLKGPNRNVISTHPTVVDLFCGAGGLSTALEAAGWQTVAGVDIQRDCIDSLQANQSRRIAIEQWPGRHFLDRTRLVCDDLKNITARDLRPKGAPLRWRPDLLAGGPPCQPFSSAGRMRGLDDPRGQLFVEFVRLTEELRPRFVLFENVAGLVTAKCPDGEPGGILELVQGSFEDIGYACRFDLLNAADYGAPQRRVRLFMIASKDEALPQFPSATHSRSAFAELGDRKLQWPTLGEFLSARSVPDEVDVVLPSKSRATELCGLKPGTGIKATGIVEANRPGGHWGYRQDCFLADLGVPARTIRAASTPDWVLLDNQPLRRLTWRECAGLQGFPSEWSFSGTIASRFRQIGNAVQGHVARAIGRALLLAALNKQPTRPASASWPASFHRRVRYTAMEEIVNGAHRAAARHAKRTASSD